MNKMLILSTRQHCANYKINRKKALFLNSDFLRFYILITHTLSINNN